MEFCNFITFYWLVLLSITAFVFTFVLKMIFMTALNLLGFITLSLQFYVCFFAVFYVLICFNYINEDVDYFLLAALGACITGGKMG